MDMDSLAVTVDCPQCGQQLKETIGGLKNENGVSCTACGAKFHLGGDRLAGVLKEAENVIADAKQRLGNIGRK